MGSLTKNPLIINKNIMELNELGENKDMVVILTDKELL
jgi:hypothetical protein